MNHESKSIISAVIASIVTSVVVVTLIASLVMNNRTQVAEMLLGTSSNAAPVQTVAGESAIETAVRKANPAVVSIIITKNEPIIERYYETVPDPFGGSFGFQIPRYRENGTREQEVGGGSGFFVSDDGLIVTNQHVVNEPDAEYTVYTNDGKKHPAKVVAEDASQDIALIKIEPETGAPYPFLNFGTSRDVALGQTVIAIGNALGEFRNTVSVGVVSGLSRSITAGDQSGGQTEELDELLQTDAAINPGNSGGPLLDINGNVIGVNVAVAASSQNIGFALPGDAVKSAVESVKAKGFISRPFMGIRYVQINETVKEEEKLSVDYGILISKGDGAREPAVIPNSPAAKAGIVENDIMLEFDGIKLTQDQKLASLIRAKKTGDTIPVKILRKGQEQILQVTLGEFSE